MIQCPICYRPMTLSDESGMYECCVTIDPKYIPNYYQGQHFQRKSDCCNTPLVFQKCVGAIAVLKCGCGKEHHFFDHDAPAIIKMAHA